MKLERVTNHDPINRLNLGLHQSVYSQVELYRELYRNAYGDELPLSQFVEEVLRRWMLADKDFQKYLADRPHLPPASADDLPMY